MKEVKSKLEDWGCRVQNRETADVEIYFSFGEHTNTERELSIRTHKGIGRTLAAKMC